MRIILSILTAGCITLWAGVAAATPSTTVWAPSTASVQGYLVPHLTYDTYFGKGVAAGQAGSPIYPVTTGLTMGVLPFEKLNMEIGFDLFVPSTYPLLLNAKLGVPEGVIFSGSPSIGVGIFGVGTKKSTSTTAGTDFNVIYGQIQKSFPFGGYISAVDTMGQARRSCGPTTALPLARKTGPALSEASTLLISLSTRAGSRRLPLGPTFRPVRMSTERLEFRHTSFSLTPSRC